MGTAADTKALGGRGDLLSEFELTLVLSHLASGDRPQDAANRAQADKFDELRALLPPAPASLSNSAGSLIGPHMHYDLLRPGIGLYGAQPHQAGSHDIAPVAHLTSHIAQIRQVPSGENVGYSGTWTAKRDSLIAVVPVGYADGYPVALSSTPGKPDMTVWIDGCSAPVVGRVSMDMITLDVTDVPGHLAVRGAVVELMGANVLADDLAARAGTIPYEIFTGLGSRVARVYSPSESL